MHSFSINRYIDVRCVYIYLFTDTHIPARPNAASKQGGEAPLRRQLHDGRAVLLCGQVSIGTCTATDLEYFSTCITFTIGMRVQIELPMHIYISNYTYKEDVLITDQAPRHLEKERPCEQAKPVLARPTPLPSPSQPFPSLYHGVFV